MVLTGLTHLALIADDAHQSRRRRRPSITVLVVHDAHRSCRRRSPIPPPTTLIADGSHRSRRPLRSPLSPPRRLSPMMLTNIVANGAHHPRHSSSTALAARGAHRSRRPRLPPVSLSRRSSPMALTGLVAYDTHHLRHSRRSSHLCDTLIRPLLATWLECLDVARKSMTRGELTHEVMTPPPQTC
ncbi:unnamed protein product [Linum trigynum]|uniref:Uncharacterized protein n=1 Tax=Linum trigynum TaxID=586398 RepID=A0AAV2F9T7_9ROSI